MIMKLDSPAPWQRRGQDRDRGVEFGVEEEACVRPSEVEEPVDGHVAASPRHKPLEPEPVAASQPSSGARAKAQVAPSLETCTPTQSSCMKFLADTSCVADDAEISLQQVRRRKIISRRSPCCWGSGVYIPFAIRVGHSEQATACAC